MGMSGSKRVWQPSEDELRLHESTGDDLTEAVSEWRISAKIYYLKLTSK